MLVDLVQTSAADGVTLDGALRTPGRPGTANLDVDAFLLLHGTGSNFYTARLLGALALHVLEWGAAALVANTRGHDGISEPHAPAGKSLQGAAFEVVDDCRHDITAWVDFLLEQGYGRVAVLGHSLGALKAVYAQARQPHPAVKRLIAVSPPRLSYEVFRAAPQGEHFLRDLAQAESLVTAGRPKALLEIKFPIDYFVSAEGFIDKYGPVQRYDLLSLVDHVACPMLFTYGTAELDRSVAFRGMHELLEAAAARGANLRVAVVAGADHVYSGAYAELAARIQSWLPRTSCHWGMRSL
jgi:alpha-beta hydrolase superfamily lysophospholipase